MQAFFPQTRDAAIQFTKLFDFVSGTLPALWNLRWQVAGFLQEVPNATEAQLQGRFVTGSNVHGSNLRRTCVEASWEEQQSQFASVALTNLFAIYEHWADQITVGFGRALSGKHLQFPDEPPALNLPGAVSKATRHKSALLTSAFYPTLVASSKYSWPAMPSLVLCYRYFKEARNSQVHGAGVASQRAENSYKLFLPHSSKTQLGMKGVLEFEPLVEGTPVRLHLRGVIGFFDILRRMMLSIDAELCQASHSEGVLERMLRATKPPRTFSAEIGKRRRQVYKQCRIAGLPRPLDVDAVYRFMRARHIIDV